MCRVEACCGISLRKWAIVVGVFSALETIALIIAGGIYLHKGLRANDFGGTTGYVRPQHRIPFDQAFGGLYVAFGTLWVICTIVYAAAVLVERALYLIPWLVLQAITVILLGAVMLSNTIALREYEWFALIPVIFLFLFFYVIVFSYYMELQELKRDATRYTTNYKH